MYFKLSLVDTLIHFRHRIVRSRHNIAMIYNYGNISKICQNIDELKFHYYYYY